MNVTLTAYELWCHMVHVEMILARFKLGFGVRFGILMVMTIESVRFWDAMPHSLVHGY